MDRALAEVHAVEQASREVIARLDALDQGSPEGATPGAAVAF